MQSDLNVTVIDASVLLTALANDNIQGRETRSLIRNQNLVAPELLDLEILAVLRRLVSSGQLNEPRANLAMKSLAALPLERFSHVSLLPRCWELRHNLTIYDASYVALAERLGATLFTSDARLSRSSGIRCQVRLIA